MVVEQIKLARQRLDMVLEYDEIVERIKWLSTVLNITHDMRDDITDTKCSLLHILCFAVEQLKDRAEALYEKIQ